MIGGPSFTNNTDAVDEIQIKNKIRAADAKATEYNFLLVLIYPLPLFFI